LDRAPKLKPWIGSWIGKSAEFLSPKIGSSKHMTLGGNIQFKRFLEAKNHQGHLHLDVASCSR
jgi:hypothetical protein